MKFAAVSVLCMFLVLGCGGVKSEPEAVIPDTPKTDPKPVEKPAETQAETPKEVKAVKPEGVFEVVEIISPPNAGDYLNIMLMAKLKVTSGRILILAECKDEFTEDWEYIEGFEIFGYIKGKVQGGFTFVSFSESKPDRVDVFRSGEKPTPQDFNTQEWEMKPDGELFLLSGKDVDGNENDFILKLRKVKLLKKNEIPVERFHDISFVLEDGGDEPVQRLVTQIKAKITPKIWKDPAKGKLTVKSNRLAVFAPPDTHKAIEDLLWNLMPNNQRSRQGETDADSDSVDYLDELLK